MKTLNFELTSEIFKEFILLNEEMIHVRGGDLDPITLPSAPPVRI